MSTMQTHEMGPVRDGRHWASAIKAKYSLTVSSTNLFLKKGSFVLDQLIKWRAGVKLVSGLSELSLKFSHFLLKFGDTLHHFLLVHERYDLPKEVYDRLRGVSANGSDDRAARNE